MAEFKLNNTNECKHCKKQFVRNSASQKFCSVKCREDNNPKLYKRDKKLVEKKKNCILCDKVFNTMYANHKYCTTTCRDESYEKAKAVPSKVSCKNCGVIFQQRTTNQVYCEEACSRKFYNLLNEKGKPRVERAITCLNCNKVFKSIFLRKYCNDECSKDYYSKKRNKKPSVSTLKTIIEDKVNSILEKSKNTKPIEFFGVTISEFTLDSFTEKIKNDVKIRDNFCCQICEVKNERLEVHHILKRKLGGSNEMDNLITLCVKCHRAIETDDKEHALKVCYKNARQVMGQSIGEKLTSAEKINILTSCLESVFDNISNDKGMDEKELLLKIDSVLSLAQ